MDFFEKKLSGKTIYDGKILKLEVDDVELYDGTRSVRECVRHSGGAAVLYVSDDKLLLVKQFRYLYQREMYEIPAGKLENLEDPADCAKRELEEETGYIAKELVPLAKIFPTSGYTDEIIYIYEAKNCSLAKRNPDEGEFLSVCFVKIDEVLKMIESGEICDAKTVVAVYRYLLNQK